MSMERLVRLVLLPELELVKSVKLSNRILGLFCKKNSTHEVCPKVSGIGKGRRPTERLRSAICWAAENFHDLSRIQRHYDRSSDTVYRATYERLELRRRKRLYPLPPVIGIDEHSLRKPKGKATVFSTIIVDHTHRRV